MNTNIKQGKQRFPLLKQQSISHIYSEQGMKHVLYQHREIYSLFIINVLSISQYLQCCQIKCFFLRRPQSGTINAISHYPCFIFYQQQSEISFNKNLITIICSIQLNFIIALNFNMEPQARNFIFSQSSFRPTEDINRGFKPVISIPITQSYHSSPKPSQIDSNISLEIKVKTFYQEYLRLLKEHRHIKTTIDHVNREKLQMLEKLNSLQQLEKQSGELKKKRHRRNANEIVRNYECPIDNCDKRYGAQASLAQHIKLKHSQFYGTQEYDKFMSNLNIKIDQSMEEQSNN